MQPEQSFDFEEMLERIDQGTYGTGSTPSSDQPAGSQEKDSPTPDQQRVELLGDASPTSSSSSSTSTGGANGSANALASSAASPSHDALVVGRVAGERALRLPEPPGTDLLRPPQA